MRVFLIIAVVFCLFFLGFQIYASMATEKSNEQPYTVIKVEKDFEIRFYPVVTMATINSTAKSYKELSSPGFRQLAGYIFGGNSTKQKIAMTSPVHMDINDSVSSMSFVMPEGNTQDNLPEPNDTKIKISASTAEYVAAIRFGGFASDKKIEEYTEKLKSALIAKSYSFYGSFRFLGYNPPFQLWGRRNEIIVSIDYKLK